MAVISFFDERAIACGDNLKNIYFRLTEILFELENVKEVIARSSGLENSVRTIDGLWTNIERIVDTYQDLCRAFETVTQIYTEAENMVVEDGEGFGTQIMHRETDIIGLGQTIELLNAFKQSTERGT